MIGHVLVNTDEVITNDYTNEHRAIDLVGAGSSISDVVSLADGVVELVVSDVKDTDLNSVGTASYGNFVKIRHENGQKTLYAHLKYGSVTVKKGDTISKGEKVGTMGATGKAYGVHLHFEIRSSDETRENPYEYLWGSKQIRAPNLIPNVEKPQMQIENEVADIKEENETTEVLIAETEEAKEEKEIVQKTIEEVKQSIPVNKSQTKNINKKEEKVIVKPKNNKKYLVNDDYEWYSIVDALKEINVDSSYSYRSLLASKNNIKNYRGTSKQNLELLKLLKNGKLLTV